jgi:hypothetical protein
MIEKIEKKINFRAPKETSGGARRREEGEGERGKGKEGERRGCLGG